MIRRAAAGLLVGVLALPACSGGGPNGANGSKDPDNSKPGPVSAQAELTYGRAPVAGGGITYQPDVVLVGGGADVVRSVSGDSMTWTIDASAPHIADLEPGKVMFLTGRGVGRVLQLEHRDDVVVVTLGPVDLTDVIYDGEINVSTPIDVGAMTFQTYPEVPGLAGSPSPTPTPSSGDGGATASPAVWTGRPAGATRASARAPEGGELPAASTGSSTEVTAGDFSAELGRKASAGEDELSLKLGYSKGGATVGLEFTAKLASPTVTASLGFNGGVLGKNELRVDGLEELSVGLISGTETGLSGNFKSRVEVPAEMTFPLPGGPVPLVASIRFKFIVETAFSARNATLEATGRLKVDGPIGFSGSQVLTPTVEQVKSPVENLTGVSVGVNGVVVALQLKVVIGLGIPAAMAGPFAAVTVAYGLTNGSAIGIVQCRQSTIDVVLAGGVGFTLAPGESTFFKTLAKELPWAPKIDSELASSSSTVVHKSDYLPKVPVCKIG